MCFGKVSLYWLFFHAIIEYRSDINMNNEQKYLTDNLKSLEYIKSKLPECYICNLDVKVIF